MAKADVTHRFHIANQWRADVSTDSTEGGEFMLNLIQTIAIRLRHREEGQTFVEYALVIAGVSIALMGTFAGLSGALDDVVTKITDAINPAA